MCPQERVFPIWNYSLKTIQYPDTKTRRFGALVDEESGEKQNFRANSSNHNNNKAQKCKHNRLPVENRDKDKVNKKQIRIFTFTHVLKREKKLTFTNRRKEALFLRLFETFATFSRIYVRARSFYVSK